MFGSGKKKISFQHLVIAYASGAKNKQTKKKKNSNIFYTKKNRKTFKLKL